MFYCLQVNSIKSPIVINCFCVATELNLFNIEFWFPFVCVCYTHVGDQWTCDKDLFFKNENGNV